jgi:glycosyltransferase involved in cell wall biosynthesis
MLHSMGITLQTGVARRRPGFGGEPHVTVCIRAHGRPDGLAAATASVLAQTYGDFEIVISDDSGQLESVADSFADPRVRYHLNPAPAGPAANLAHAVGLARGPLLAILNDDDRWLPRFLSTTVDVLERHPDVGVVFTNDFFEIGARSLPRGLPFRPGRHEHFLREFLEHSLPASATVMRRTVWDEGERAVPLSPQMVGDIAVWIRSANAGWPFYYVDEPLAVSCVHPEQVSWSEDGLPSRNIATYAAFVFDDSVCEELRRARLTESFLARAHVHLTRRRFHDAWADIGRAHKAAPRPMGLRAALALSGLRALTMRWGSSHPGLLVPLLKLWRRFRPPVLPRRTRPGPG